MPEVPRILRILLPPVWFLAFLGGQFAFDRWLPLAEILQAPWRYVGVLFIMGGIALAQWANSLFKRAGTDVVPFRNVTAFVATGPYRFSRNPMYLGMVLILTGAAILFGSVTPFLVIPGFMAVIVVLFIRREEALLEAKFGSTYLDYKRRVRRWVSV